jgi:hypothetical protein
MEEEKFYLQGYQPLKCEDSWLTLWLQGTFINFREEEIFIFGAWVYAIMRLTTPTPFAN